MTSNEDKDLLQQITYLSKLIKRHKNMGSNKFKLQLQKNNFEMINNIAGPSTSSSSSTSFHSHKEHDFNPNPKFHHDQDTRRINSSANNKVFIKSATQVSKNKVFIKNSVSSDSTINTLQGAASSSSLKPSTILINPKFQAKRSKILVNPHFSVPIKANQTSEVHAPAKTPNTAKYTLKTNRKLVRENIPQAKKQSSNPLVAINKRILVRLDQKCSSKVQENRKQPPQKIAKKLKNSQYKFVKTNFSTDHRQRLGIRNVRTLNKFMNKGLRKQYKYCKPVGQGTTKKPSVINIQGQKYKIDAEGKTLKRVTGLSTNPKPRIQIAGVTFTSTAPNVYERTNHHMLRTIVSQAKHKSISLLVNKLKKNNKPCVFYRKFGKCLRQEKGRCPCLHNPKQIAICKKFLLGQCELSGCLLSHDVRPEKMPTCSYFLAGCCTRDHCPYSHVKVNANAEICTEFLSGYCNNGNLCKKRHVNTCPEFERSGKCSRGKLCPYPHNNESQAEKNKSKFIVMSQESSLVASHSSSSLFIDKQFATSVESKGTISEGPESRYYQGDNAEKSAEQKESNDTIYIPASKKQKIGSLPSFIPL